MPKQYDVLKNKNEEANEFSVNVPLIGSILFHAYPAYPGSSPLAVCRVLVDRDRLPNAPDLSSMSSFIPKQSLN